MSWLRRTPHTLTLCAGAIFRQGNTLQALETNYRTLQALQNAQQHAAANPAAQQQAHGIEALGAGAAAMDVSDGEDEDGNGNGVDGDGEDFMAVDGGAGTSGRGGRPRGAKVSPEFKAKVLRLLEENEFDQLRSSKMGQEEFLKLLALFNAAGIHFA